MSDTVIRAAGLGKKYLIGHDTERERYTTLRDVLMRTARGFARSALDMARGRQLLAGDEVEEFWALKNVDFEIKRGEVVGIIGRNGAGKSTLLKILSRITEPSKGRVEIRGRVASLLEVGTGFHPELTGRENIFLNGAILGMSRAEIRRKFDEIVAFAEVEKFLDTPVKRYSSGMYVRLAFAVAAHLEPEILVVDEVLAVGDAEFQKKCLGKMQDVAGHGRTVLFVSHNMPAVRALCGRSLLLNKGRIAFSGETEDAIAVYLGSRRASEELCGSHIDVQAGVLPSSSGGLAAVTLQFRITLRGKLTEPKIGFGVNDASGQRVVTLFTEASGQIPPVEEDEAITFNFTTEPLRLAPGSYWIKVSLAEYGSDKEVHDDSINLIVPQYNPFERQPQYWPRGPFLVPCLLSFEE